ncbi:hypothetical protein JS530_00715 [Bifidobacterium sp. LC6]|uniref:Uncharacterized protein n=1 Tax=Bifidobacterium colobi TaxID=2809026 RepID=A0ABS5UTG4_9BIFI|nr:hypothetical protein [Bifidobacterium colobi]MBT1174053.1 hypothetical protein [Bifidobacterium colobi]
MMANEGLKAEVARKQGVLNGVNHANDQLAQEISYVVGAMDAANRDLNNTSDNIRAHLGGASNTLGSAHQQIIAAYEVQQSMDALYMRLKQMELANKRIRECNNKKFYDFAVYRTVRKIVQGIMDNLDFSMISEQVIAKAVERKQLENPDYWLTSVLVAVVAWHADQRERAQRALDRAMKLDGRKTASFLMIFYLRLHREQTALKWFSYLASGKLKGAEKPMVLLFFSMLSKTIEDSMSDQSRQIITRYINTLIADGMRRGGQAQSATIGRIADAFAALADDASFPYEAIRGSVPSYAGLQRSLQLAANNANVIDFIAEIMNVEEAQRNEFLKQYIDFVVAAPCTVEQQVYDEIDRNEYIIKFQGDVQAAQQAYEAHKQHDVKDFDIITEMMDWIYTTSGRAESNPQMRKNMLVATKELQQQAGDLYIQRYRTLFTPVQHIVIDDFAIQGDLRNVEGNAAQAKQFYEGKAAVEKAQVKDIWSIVLMVAGVLGGVGLAFVQPALAGLGALAAIGGGVWMLMNHFTRKRIDLKYAQIIRSTRDRLQALFADWQQLERDFHAKDLLAQTLVDRLAEL